jgi:hypothetical protein
MRRSVLLEVVKWNRTVLKGELRGLLLKSGGRRTLLKGVADMLRGRLANRRWNGSTLGGL